MSDKPTGAIAEHFATLKDPRSDYGKRHQLFDILVIALCGTICGADDWVEIALFAESKRQWLETFLELPSGLPSHDTFGRVFARLDPQEFQKCFLSWVKAISELTKGQVIAIDGKTSRRSHDRYLGKAAIQMVSAWAEANRLVLGQVKVAEGSNEISAIPELLKVLEVAGCIVTIDAIGCQTEHAQMIVEKQGDYVLAVKENQEHLHDDLQDLFAAVEEPGFQYLRHDYQQTIEKDHGRMETRRCWVTDDPACLDYVRDHEQWKGLRSLVMVKAERCINGKCSSEVRYYISSLEGKAGALLQAVRGHWSIENSLHWVLDIAFREDESRVRKDNGPQNFAILRHIALNLLRQEPATRCGVKGKRLKAAWNQDYLLKILVG